MVILCKLYCNWNLHNHKSVYFSNCEESEEAYKQVQLESEIPLTQHEIVQEIKEIRRILEELEKRIGEDDESKVK